MSEQPHPTGKEKAFPGSTRDEGNAMTAHDGSVGSEHARREVEASRETRACVICRWPGPYENSHHICECCGFQQDYDAPEIFKWDGKWWAQGTGRKPQILEAAEQRLGAVEAALRTRAESILGRMQREVFAECTFAEEVEQLIRDLLGEAAPRGAEMRNWHSIVGPNGMCECGVKSDGTVVTCGALLKAEKDGTGDAAAMTLICACGHAVAEHGESAARCLRRGCGCRLSRRAAEAALKEQP